MNNFEEKLNKLKDKSHIHLSEEEKSILRASIARTIISKPNKKSIGIFENVLQHGLRIILSTFIFMIFVAGSVSVVADNSLPGDPLYAFKVNVNEEIRGAFLNSPEKKTAWQQDRIDNRLNEIQTLAETKTLTKAKQATVQKALDSHIYALTKDLNTKDSITALKITSGIEENLKKSKAALSDINSTDSSDSQKAEALQTVDTALNQVSAQEVKIISNEMNKIKETILDLPPVEVDSILNEDTSLTDKNNTSSTTDVNVKNNASTDSLSTPPASQ